MSRSPLFPTKPAEITLDTLPELFAHHRARFGGWSMTQTAPEPAPPERPEDIDETAWNALGDPGKQVIVREREARQAAERALAASHARPAPPKPDDKSKSGDRDDKRKGGDQPKSGDVDIEDAIQRAVQAAVKPFADAEDRRATQQAAERVQTAVLEAAKPWLHDPTDALANIDLTAVVDDQGRADPAKTKTALDDLVTRKPHLAKSAERRAPDGIGGGAPAGATDGEKVKAVLADMQRATGVRPPGAVNGTT